MIARLILAFALLLAPVCAFANDLEGAWALRIDGATIFRFELDRDEDGEWSGTWTRPETFGSNGVVFSRLEGSEDVRSMAGLDFAGDVELSFDDPRPGAIPDIFRFRHLSDGHAQLTYVGTDLAPYPLVAVPAGTPLGPFEDGRVYDRDNAQRVSDYVQAMEQVFDPLDEEVVEEAAEPISQAFSDDLQIEDAEPAEIAGEEGAGAPDTVAEPWQPDPSVRAAIEARARALEEGASVETDAELEEQPAERESQIGSDFLDGL